MARFNEIQIGSLYLTDTGLVGGVKCKSEVDGLDALLLNYTGAVIIAADGTPHAQIADNTEGKGAPIAIRPFVLTTSVFTSLKTIFNTALAGGTSINVIITGDTGTFNLQCLPGLPKPIAGSGKFINGRIFEETINFVVLSIN